MPGEHARVKAPERLVWDLLTRDFTWVVPADFGVQVEGKTAEDGSVRLQVFELAVAKIFSRLRPEYDWYVTPNRPDGGVDFIGRHGFLEDEALGIAAAITIGGQCKKRTTVHDVVEAVDSSLIRMSDRIDPTFFVVALSARLTKTRVAEAQRLIERIHHRHCHILDRAQLEGLIRTHLDAVRPILRAALADDELSAVLAYFTPPAQDVPATLEIRAPDLVLAGLPFSVVVHARTAPAGARIRWRPRDASDTVLVALIGPVGAEAESGSLVTSRSATDDPLRRSYMLEFVSYAIGTAPLGEVAITAPGGAETWEPLGGTRVVENLRPRFFERPFSQGLAILEREYDRALAAGVGAVGVAGAGGSGKSRLCEEFALERRRRGAEVVVAKQSKSLDDPHRLLADMLVGLAGEDVTSADPADGVVEAITRYDSSLGRKVTPAIRATLGRHGDVAEEQVLSSLVVLVMARSRQSPLVVHLQDLHWCAADVLGLVERLLWHLEHIQRSHSGQDRGPACGALFILEGRSHERADDARAVWSTEAFEAMLRKLDCPTVDCAAFTRDDGREFIRRLFEARHSARRRGSDDLLELQSALVDRVDAASGGNPFHSLEQVRRLRERRVLGQNPETGLLHLVRPDVDALTLPDTVFAAVHARWSDVRGRDPELALLLWGAALLEDRLPMALFLRLRRELAPAACAADADATEMMWTVGGTAPEAAFRHENHFHTLRRLEVPTADRDRVVAVYDAWFASAEHLEPLDRFRWARALLEAPQPEERRAQALLREALAGARAAGDHQLARRVAAKALDLEWATQARSATAVNDHLRLVDEEIELVRELLESDRQQAAERLEALRRRVEDDPTDAAQSAELERRRLLTETLRANVLFNDRRPSEAAEVAARVCDRIRRLHRDEAEWRNVEMEALHAQGVGLALAGEIDAALDACRRAVVIARSDALGPSHHVITTYANVLLARDPDEAEKLMRDCAAAIATSGTEAERYENDLNLGMALLLRAYRTSLDRERHDTVAESRTLLSGVFIPSFRFGRYPHAGAAALLLGLLSVVADEGDGPHWFAQAVIAAARGQQMETLWRAHSNLALALHQRGVPAGEAVRDHARAVVEILEESLSPYAEADQTARFRLVSVPLAQAVRLLLLAGDELALRILERHPTLRPCFSDPGGGVLAEDRGGFTSHEWLRVGDGDYVIY